MRDSNAFRQSKQPKVTLGKMGCPGAFRAWWCLSKEGRLKDLGSEGEKWETILLGCVIIKAKEKILTARITKRKLRCLHICKQSWKVSFPSIKFFQEIHSKIFPGK